MHRNYMPTAVPLLGALFFVKKRWSTVRYDTTVSYSVQPHPRNGTNIIFLVSRRSCFRTTRHTKSFRQPSSCKSLKGESNHDGTKFYATLCKLLLPFCDKLVKPFRNFVETNEAIVSCISSWRACHQLRSSLCFCRVSSPQWHLHHTALSILCGHCVDLICNTTILN